MLQLLHAGTWLGIFNNILRYSPYVEEALTQLKFSQDASGGGKKIQQIYLSAKGRVYAGFTK